MAGSSARGPEVAHKNTCGACVHMHQGKMDTTVPIFNSCTKCLGSPGIIHNRTPDCHSISWPWMHG